MRVVLQGSLGLYGVETFVHRLYHHLNKMGFDVSIAAPFGRTFIRAGRSKLPTNSSPPEDSKWWIAYRGANLIHLSYAVGSLPLVYDLARCPFIYTIHGMPDPAVESELLFKFGYTFERLTLKRVAKGASRVVAISRYARDLLLSRFGIDAVVIRHGVDTDLFHPAEESARSVLMSRLQLSAERRMVLYVGRLHPSKDPLTLVRSIPRVVSKNPNAYFVFIGDGPMKNAMESEISHLNLQSFCRLIPRLEHSLMPQWYQACQLFVSTAPREMLGLAVLEAMSSGVPVIASSSGGPPEVLGSSGVFFESGDSVGLADNISKLISDENCASEMGRRTRETAVRDLKWDDVANRYADLYRDVARAS